MRRPHSTIASIVGALFFAAACSPLLADTYYVRQTGDDRADGKTAKTAFKTILHAAQVLNYGDSIVVGPGTYRETVFFAERYSADGARMSVVGDESGKLTGDAAGPVVVEPASLSEAALRFCRFRNLSVSGLTVRGAGDGLVLEKCLSVAVERCTFVGLRRGVNAQTTNGLRVESCVFNRCTIGLSLQGVTDARIAHVTMVNTSSAGILVLACGPGAIRNCIFAANNTNFMLDKVSAPSWTSDCNVISGTTGPWGLTPMVYFGHEWYAASGQDRHSVYVPPSFVDPQTGDLHVDPQVRWGGGLPGMRVGARLDPEVKLDRDGKPLAVRDGAVCAGAHDYPDPKPGEGWKKMGVTLKGEGPRQSAGIYKADGTLVRMLVSDVAGVSDLWWDGLDDAGQPAAPGEYQMRAAVHDVRLLDDGNFGDNGNPSGTYNCDNPERIAVLPDGRFVVTTAYDEAGIPLRLYAASGQSVAGVNLAEKDVWAIALSGNEFIAGVGDQIVRIVLPGDRARMANGAEGYAILAGGEALQKGERPSGLAVVGSTAYVALRSMGVVRGIDLSNGARKSDWRIADVADVGADGKGVLWAVSGKEILSLKADGQIEKRYPTGLDSPQYLAVGAGRLAAVDRKAERIAVLDAASGKVIRTLGSDRPADRWLPVSGNVLNNPRGAAFLPDGRLLVAEGGRVRAIWPETAQVSFTIESNFMDVAVPHPTRPEYVYCYRATVFRVDPKTGAWERKAEGPPVEGVGSVSTSVVLNGRPFIVAFNSEFGTEKVVDGQKKMVHASQLTFFDVSDPVNPRLSSVIAREPHWAYATVAFTKEGHMVFRGPSRDGGYSVNFRIVPFKGLDAQKNPTYDFDNTQVVGPEKDPSPRGMAHNAGIALDQDTNDFYYMAVTAQHNKMVPAWGASGSGVGRSKADGTPLWFSLSSGGNYTSMDCLRDGANVWVMAGKDFGGQVDVYDADGLRLTTGNWGWPSNWQMGFVDMRFALQAYMRPDGKPCALVEDDCIGRFTRVRLDGKETLKKTASTFQWGGSDAGQKQPPVADVVEGGKSLTQPLVMPKVAELKVDGDWTAWEKAGVVPQLISLPAVTWGRSWPDDLFQTFRAGTSIGAFAHDGKNLYAYFLTTDDTQHFDAENPGLMWEFDSIELWLEEEQIGMGFLKNGKAALFKYRYHNREGKEWAANYLLPDGNVWGRRYDNLDAHPLGRQLAAAAGSSFEGKSGYALMAKIPFEEIKLVGGIAGRKGKDILPLTGAPGEILRIGVAFDGISCWGREQDFKVYWPIGLMFSDPTRNTPFELGK